MKIYFDKELYNKDVLIKASYSFIDDAYVYLYIDDNKYVVELSLKTDRYNVENIEAEFKNEMLRQCARQIVYNNTKDLRKIILARAMASTIVCDDNTSGVYDSSNEELETILSDWFDGNDKPEI